MTLVGAGGASSAAVEVIIYAVEDFDSDDDDGVCYGVMNWSCRVAFGVKLIDDWFNYLFFCFFSIIFFSSK